MTERTATQNHVVARVYAAANIAMPNPDSAGKLDPVAFEHLCKAAGIADPATVRQAFINDGRLAEPPDQVLTQSEVATMIADAVAPLAAQIGELQGRLATAQVTPAKGGKGT